MRAMHAANRLAWDEAAERYEGWFEEAVELIRSGGCNLYPVEQDLIGDLRGRCRRAIHLQCAGGRDTLSLWNLGRGRGRGRGLQPAHARPGAAAHARHGRAGDLGRGGRPRRPARARRHRGPPLHGPRRHHLAPGPGRLGGRAAAAPGPRRSPRHLRRPPRGVAVRRRRAWRLDAHRLRLLRRPRGVAGLGTGVHRPAVHPGGRAALEVRPRLDPRRDHHGARWAPACASSASPSTRWTGGPATATSDPTSAAACPCRSPSWRRAETEGRRARPRERTGPRHPP